MRKKYGINSKIEQKSSIKKYFDKIEFERNEKVWPHDHIWFHYLGNEYNFLHYHDCLELGITKSGNGIFHINDKNIRFNGPTLSIVFPNTFHSATKIGNEDSVWNFLYVDIFNLLKKDSEINIDDLKGSSIILKKEKNEELYNAIDLFITLSSKENASKSIILSSLLKCIIILSKNYLKLDNGNIDEFNTVLPAINYINKNYKNKITNKDLAKISFLSISSLRRSFLRITGLTPYAYVEKVRIDIAKTLLYSNEKIESIAFECGYPSVSCFNKKFKAINGISPKKYQLSKKLK